MLICPNYSNTQNKDKSSCGYSEKKSKGGKGGNDNKGGNSGNSGNSYNCGEPYHVARNCPMSKSTTSERKVIRHKNLPTWRLKAPGHDESHTKNVDVRT